MEEYNLNPIVGENKEDDVQLMPVRLYLYVALGMVLTFITCIAWPYIVLGICGQSDENGIRMFSNAAYALFYIAMVISIIYLAVAAVIMVVRSFSKNPSKISTKTKSIAILYYIYTIEFGICYSSLYYIAMQQVYVTIPKFVVTAGAMTFGVGAGSMLVAALISFLMKKKYNKYIPLLISLAIGLLVITLINIFLWPLSSSELNQVYWYIDYTVLVLMFCSVAFNTWSLNFLKKRLKVPFSDSLNFTYYCAFEIYLDFIWLIATIFFGSRSRS